jgi:hypothetical protein
MSQEESDGILNVPFRGSVRITIEGVVKPTSIYGNSPLRNLVSQVFCDHTGEPVLSSIGNNPWVVVSYDKAAGELVVKKKVA